MEGRELMGKHMLEGGENSKEGMKETSKSPAQADSMAPGGAERHEGHGDTSFQVPRLTLPPGNHRDP